MNFPERTLTSDKLALISAEIKRTRETTITSTMQLDILNAYIVNLTAQWHRINAR